MGVMQCQRADCDNILCNRYSMVFGYICDECFEELVASGKEGLLRVEIFMNSSPVSSLPTGRTTNMFSLPLTHKELPNDRACHTTSP